MWKISGGTTLKKMERYRTTFGSVPLTEPFLVLSSTEEIMKGFE